MKQIVIILSLIFLIIGCNKIKNTNEELTEFDKYSNKIENIKLPLETNCNEWLSSSQKGISDSLIKSFGIEFSKIFGKLSENENYTAIVYLYPADDVIPIIKTTDKNGNEISTLSLFEKFCGEDEFSWNTSWAKINQDLTIQLSDSSIIYESDKNGERIEESRKTETRHRFFYINKKGEIVEKKQKNAL